MSTLPPLCLFTFIGRSIAPEYLLQLYSGHCPSNVFLSAYNKTFTNILLSKRRLILLCDFSIWINKFLLTCGLKSNKDMILAGKLQFYQLQKSWLKQKIQAQTRLKSRPLHFKTNSGTKFNSFSVLFFLGLSSKKQIVDVDFFCRTFPNTHQ